MRRASGFFCVAALFIALLLLGASEIARAQDGESASHLKEQIAAFVSMPLDATDPASSDEAFDLKHSNLPGDASQGGGPTEADAMQPASPPFAVFQSWSFEGNGQEADDGSAPEQSFLADMPPDTQGFYLSPETGYDKPAEKPSGPRDFQISDSLRLKAQPLGGGLGGRVTLTFSFTTGY